MEEGRRVESLEGKRALLKEVVASLTVLISSFFPIEKLS